MTLRVEGASRSFGRRRVLHGVDLEVADGARVALLGPNGSGKTTLLRLAAGVLRPTAGRVLHDGHDTLTPEGRRALAFVPQGAPAYPELTVLEHVRWWTAVHGVPADAQAAVDDAGLHRLAHGPATALSRGQRQRLALAMALAVRPRTLLLDEPTTALDADGQDWLLHRLRQTDAAVLVATHEVGFADALGAETRRMDGGRLA